MVFNSIAFILFFIIFYTFYILIKKRENKILLCLIGSYFFYGWWDWRFLFLLLYSTTIDYLIGKRIYSEKNHKRKKYFLILSLTLNLGLLFFFKYFNFFIDSFLSIAGFMGLSPQLHVLQIILPVGISFYTFQALSYTIDIYYERLKPESDFIVFATYVSFFPQLVAGPIVRAIDLLPQFKLNPKITTQQISNGLLLIALGFFKKLVIADSVAPLVDDAFANPSNYTSLNMILAVVFYAFQIYCDFSGYSDIAIGLGKMTGYNFPVNFNLPYFATNFSDFWKRWHITLSSWLRDYLYIPLGGNKKGWILTQRNLILTMLLGGLWHGANWTFIIWGLLHALFLIAQRAFRPITNQLERYLPKLMINFLGMIMTFVLVNIAWVFFRSQTVEEAFNILNKIFTFDNMSFAALKPKFQLFKAILVISLLFVGEFFYLLFPNKVDTLINETGFAKMLIIAFFLWMILLFGSFSNNNFIYFQF